MSKKRGAFSSAWLRCSECGCAVVYDPKRKLIKNTGEYKTYHYYRCSNGKKQRNSFKGRNVSEGKIWGQLEKADEILNNRLNSWYIYYEALKGLEEKGYIELPTIPEECIHNAHMFYIKVKNLEIRTKLLNYLKENGIWAVFHYVPLHTSEAGKMFGRFEGTDEFTTKESERLIRLPMFYGLKREDINYVVSKINKFFNI